MGQCGGECREGLVLMKESWELSLTWPEREGAAERYCVFVPCARLKGFLGAEKGAGGGWQAVQVLQRG